MPRLLHEAGLLGRFYTDSYAGKPTLAVGIGPRRGLSARREATCIRIGGLGRAVGAAASLGPPVNDATITPRVIVAQVGAQRNYAVARALRERGCLEALSTDACPSGWSASVVGPWLRGAPAH